VTLPNHTNNFRTSLNRFSVSSGLLAGHDSDCSEFASFRMIHNVSNCSCTLRCVWLLSMVLFADAVFADPQGPNPLRVIEVFTSEKYPVIDTDGNGARDTLRGLKITVHKIDGIQSVERDLSLNLPVNPQAAKQIALHRIQRLDEQTRSSMHSAATALAKAMQYGLDRYPAVVFDGEAVVYGVTDLTVALEQYRAWQAGLRP